MKNKQEKGQSSSVILKSGIWFTICNIVTKSVGFLTTPIFTRLLTKAEFGDYNNFTTWTGIILLITSLNLESSIIRARYEFGDDLDNYVASMSFLSCLSTLVWFVLFLCFINPAQELLSLSRMQIYGMFLYLMFYPTIQLFQTRERYQYRYQSTVLITLLVIVGTALLSVFLVLLMENKLAGRIIGTVAPVVAIGLILLFVIFKKANGINTSYWKYALPFTLPFIPHLLSMYLLGSMDKVMIRQICGSEDLAMYSLAYTVGTIITLMVNSMNSAFSPWLGEQLSKKEYSRVRKISVPYVGLFTIFALIAVMVTPEILLILGGKSYAEAKNVIPQIFAGCLMQFIYCMYVNVEQFEKKTVGMAAVSVLAATFNYVTNYIFIRKYGYIAASYTTFFSYLLLMLMHMWLVRRIDRQDVYNNSVILLMGGMGSVLLISMNLIFEMTMLRYVVFLVFLVVILASAYLKKDMILKYIRRRQ